MVGKSVYCLVAKKYQQDIQIPIMILEVLGLQFPFQQNPVRTLCDTK